MTIRILLCVSVVFLAIPLLASALGPYENICPNLSRSLSLGSRGQDVVRLQSFLIGQGDLRAGNNSGYFGKLTEAAVKKFQCRKSIVCSGGPVSTGYGVVGARTRTAIASSCGGPSNPGGPPNPPAPMSCNLNGVVIQNGASVTAYQSSSVPAGEQCASQERVCTNGTLSGSFLYSACTPLAAPGGRTLLKTPTTFYVSPSGSDTTGDGSLAKPWATGGHAYAEIQKEYDLGGQQTTIKFADGTYDYGLTSDGPLVGQNNANQLIVEGNVASPSKVLIQPGINHGYAFSAAHNASYTLRGFKMDMRYGNADTIGIGQFSGIIISDLIFGSNPWTSGQSFNDLSVAINAYVEVAGDYSIEKPAYLKTASYAAGVNNFTMADTSNVIPYAGVVGAGIPPGTYVTSVSGTGVGLSQATTQAVSGGQLVFTPAGQDHIDLGNQGQLYYDTNSDPGYAIHVRISGYPFYYSGFAYVNSNSILNTAGVTFQGVTNGETFVVRGNSTIDSGFAGVPQIPGSLFTTIPAAFAANVDSIKLASVDGIKVGNAVNGYTETTANYSAGSKQVTVTNPKSIEAYNHVHGPGIEDGTIVTAISGNTITLSFPAKANGDGSTTVLTFTGTGVKNGTTVKSISGTTIYLSQPTVSAQDSVTLFFSGSVIEGGRYN